GLLGDLGADPVGSGAEELGTVAALGQLFAALGECAPERGERLMRRHDCFAFKRPVEAGSLAGVTGGSRRLDQREKRVRVAVVADRAQPLDVAGGLALAPQLVARAAPEVDL